MTYSLDFTLEKHGFNTLSEIDDFLRKIHSGLEGEAYYFTSKSSNWGAKGKNKDEATSNDS